MGEEQHFQMREQQTKRLWGEEEAQSFQDLKGWGAECGSQKKPREVAWVRLCRPRIILCILRITVQQDGSYHQTSILRSSLWL